MNPLLNTPKNPLWLALHLPLLPLEARGRPPSPSAVAEQGRIIACDEAVAAAGIRHGTGVAAARALLPSIQILQREPGRELAALYALACWSGRFTPRVSLALPDALLLEVGGCLRLFGDLETLVIEVTEGLQSQGYTPRIAVAPTPQAALWLTQRAKAVLCRDHAALHSLLGALPVAVLPDQAAQALRRFGARSLAEARRLPAHALARRIGAESMKLMARAFGELPDLRPDFDFPDSFEHGLELPAPVENTAALLFAARRLTMALAGWLAVRQAGVAACTLRLTHRRGETMVTLRFSDPTRDGERITRVLHERLQRMKLTAPVEWLHLAAADLRALAGRSGALFGDAATARAAMGALFDRLRARLGEESVQGLALRADHRPECASAAVQPDDDELDGNKPVASSYTARPRPAAESGQGISTRPFWLLEKPQALIEVGGRPHRCGPLRLLAGPERIESGWWDQGEAAGDVRRDYFVALTTDQRWLWIFRDCRLPGGWFVHGFF